MRSTQDMKASSGGAVWARVCAEIGVFGVAAAVIAASAIFVKEVGTGPALAAVSSPVVTPASAETREVVMPTHEPAPAEVEVVADEQDDEAIDTDTRYFNGRPVRPARTIMMTVTGYSPDSRSCGEYADGKTATLHSVWTNRGKLVAADTKVLPYGSMLTVPGYDSDDIVPVLDCGGAINGNRLDLLFPTHEQARRWGVKTIPVVVWEYADGQGHDDPRKFRRGRPK